MSRIADITTEMRPHQEETFDPVASLYKVGSQAEALHLANARPYGLGTAFRSNHGREIERAESAIEADAVFVNSMTLSYPELPFGGVKRSGLGRELPIEGIREFCNLKTVRVA